MDTNKTTAISISGNTLYWKSPYKKPVGRFWKRFYNKKVRNMEIE